MSCPFPLRTPLTILHVCPLVVAATEVDDRPVCSMRGRQEAPNSAQALAFGAPARRSRAVRALANLAVFVPSLRLLAVALGVGMVLHRARLQLKGHSADAREGCWHAGCSPTLRQREVELPIWTPHSALRPPVHQLALRLLRFCCPATMLLPFGPIQCPAGRHDQIPRSDPRSARHCSSQLPLALLRRRCLLLHQRAGRRQESRAML